MFNDIKSFFAKTLAVENKSAKDQTRKLHIATAALLIEVMMSDDEHHQQEIHTIIHSLQRLFELTPADTDELIALARKELSASTDYFQFTSLIHKEFPLDRKIAIVELLWQVAYADGTLDAYEEHLIRRIADLLYISHTDFIATKLRAENRMNDAN